MLGCPGDPVPGTIILAPVAAAKTPANKVEEQRIQ